MLQTPLAGTLSYVYSMMRREDCSYSRSIQLPTVEAGIAKWEPQRSVHNYVRKNLYNFLVEMRRRRHMRFMWLDALCINQGSNDDKVQNLAKTKRIYWWCDIVVSSVGKGSGGDEAAIKRLPKIIEWLSELSSPGLAATSNLSTACMKARFAPIGAETRPFLRKLVTSMVVQDLDLARAGRH